MELLQEHLMIAVFLGALSAGFIEGLKNKNGFNLTGNWLALFSIAIELAVAGTVGAYYLGLTGPDLIAVMAFTFAGAETVYAAFKPFADKNKKTDPEGIYEYDELEL